LTFFSHFTTAAQIAAPAGDYGIPHSALEYQEMLKQARLAVFGLGRLGSSLVQKLALAGVGAIRGVDDGFISAEDVQAGVYRACMLGESRVKALQTLVAEVNPWVEFSPASQAVQTLDEICSLLRGSTFAILSADAFNPGYYELFNQACLAENVPWTSCRLLGFEFLLGPTVIPHQTSCFKCFDLRQKGNLTDYQEYLLLEEYLRSSPLHSGALAITPGIDLAALEVLKALTRFMQPATYSHLYSLNLLSMESKRHPILKLPRCPHCGRSARNHPAIELWQPELIVQESSSPDLAPPVVTQDQIES
jgi:bacteriocin biosynthesis cyclodehydratase domain-containing protein